MLVLVLGIAFWKQYFNFQSPYNSTRMKKRTNLQSSLESARLCPCLLTLPVLVAITHTEGRSRTLVTCDRQSSGSAMVAIPIRSDQTHGRRAHIVHRAHTWASHIWTDPIFYTCLSNLCNLSSDIAFRVFSLIACLQAIPHHKDSWSPFNVFTWSFQGYYFSVTDGERGRNTFWKGHLHCTACRLFQFWTPT